MLKKLLILLPLVTLLVAWIIIPMPQLITYERAQVVSKGVYWRGFGESGQLMDARASYVKIDESTNHLHICYQFENVDSCQQYQILKSQGLFAVISYLL